MSREPHWYSTVFGFIVVHQPGRLGTVLSDPDAVLCSEMTEPIQSMSSCPIISTILDNVLLTFVILWAYLSFAQFLVIWLGNTQGEITWYIRRTDGGWRWVGRR